MKTFLIISFLLILSIANAQQPQIGGWRDHLPFGWFRYAGETTDHFFGANDYGVLSLHKETMEIEKHNKTTSLSDVSISAFTTNHELDIAIVGYENGNLDILTLPEITNQPAILRSNMQGSKRINKIKVISKQVYICTGFGIVKMDPETFDILDSYLIGQGSANRNVLDIQAFDNKLYVSTDAGLYSASISDPYLANSAVWSYHDSLPQPLHTLFTFGEKLYGIHQTGEFNGDVLYVYNEPSFIPANLSLPAGINSVTVKNDTILIAHEYQVSAYDTFFHEIGKIFTYGDNSSATPNHATFSPWGNSIVVADKTNGLAITTLENQFNSDVASISSPQNMNALRLSFIENALWALGGGNEGAYLQPEVNILENEDWKYLNLSLLADSLRNLRNAVEAQGSIFFASNQNGIIEYRNNQVVEVFNASNSTIQDASPNHPYDFYGITDITKDDLGIIWAANANSSKPLIGYNPKTKKWASFPQNGPLEPTDRVYAVPGHDIILVPQYGSGVLAHNTQGTEIFEDDLDKLLTTSNAGLPTNDINCLVLDNDGELWIGSTAGIAVIHSPGNIFSANFEGAQKILVRQDNYNGYLLETEIVTSIAVDGANRKWIGTNSSGVYLVSEDGKDLVHHFTEDDSPLLSNNIFDIAIDPDDGEVFFATLNGLVSYRSDATAPNEGFSAILAFPNPVKPSHTGPIAITGLMENSVVKITDAAGNLVHETLSQGGQAIWNGKLFDGTRAATGVYLIMCSTPDGTNSAITKLFFLN